MTGNHVREASLTAPVVVASWYFVKGVDVKRERAEKSERWWRSATRLRMGRCRRRIRIIAGRTTWLCGSRQCETAHLSVLDEGIGGNCVLIHCVGQNALARFNRDVLSQAGVKYVIILESINDIGRLKRPNLPDYKLTAEDLEQGLRNWWRGRTSTASR